MSDDSKQNKSNFRTSESKNEPNTTRSPNLFFWASSTWCRQPKYFPSVHIKQHSWFFKSCPWWCFLYFGHVQTRTAGKCWRQKNKRLGTDLVTLSIKQSAIVVEPFSVQPMREYYLAIDGYRWYCSGEPRTWIGHWHGCASAQLYLQPDILWKPREQVKRRGFSLCIFY